MIGFSMGPPIVLSAINDLLEIAVKGTGRIFVGVAAFMLHQWGGLSPIQWAAMVTPALLIIPLVHFVGRKMEHPRVKGVLHTVVIASAGLLPAAAVPRT
jgi:chromate transporter